jgi:hypothetical protein
MFQRKVGTDLRLIFGQSATVEEMLHEATNGFGTMDSSLAAQPGFDHVKKVTPKAARYLLSAGKLVLANDMTQR